MAQIRLEHNIWLLVADGEKALFLRNEGNPFQPRLQVVRAIHEENPPNRQQSTDAPGRYFDGANVHKSGFEETDWHRIGKERFAEEIADRLYRLAHRGRFEKIVLVAPPLVLGALRKALHKEVSDRVAGEVAKTLTGHTREDIERILATA
ncbi:host attachment family protein [Chelativorans intermedius]|uniref:Host attachment family protein n=1 Tax=Chelativorans intermedius TaxID=515947 RepID=A0ABV6DCF9_9HYPH|nr:host attachment family protein [Chelativorans intermedius]MCT9000039.1 host attachment family protein [Chelativorans intermedius]